MSWKAQAWAVDQKAGSPVKKLVLIMLAEAAHRETHRSWVSVARLSSECECDERTVRSALKDLAAGDFIRDSGDRVGRQKNVTVWTFPRFEAFIASNPDKSAGVAGVEGSRTPQAADLTSESGTLSTDSGQPSQNCEGSANRTPTVLQLNPDKSASGTLAKVSGESCSEPVKESKTRAGEPSGPARRRSRDDDKPYDHSARSEHWRRMAVSWVVGECNGFGITSQARQWSELPTDVRLVMPSKIEAAITKATNHEQENLPLAERIIRAQLEQSLTDELRAFKPSSRADISSAHAA